MDTNTQVSHRHFLGFPLFALALVASLSLPSISALSLQATVLPWQEEEVSQGRVFATDTLSGMIFKGTTAEEADGSLMLEQGSVLVAGEGVMHVVAGNFTVMGASGVLHITHQDSTLTVAALTSPALISGGKTRVLLPVGYQWTSQERSDEVAVFAWDTWFADTAFQVLPQDFIQEQLALQAEFPQKESIAVVEPREVPVAGALELPGALERRTQEWEQDIPAMIRSLAYAHDTSALQAFIAQPEVQEVLSQEHTRQLLLPIVAEAQEGTPVRTVLLPFVSKDTDLSLLLALHPSFRTSMGGRIRLLDQGTENTMLFVKTFPFAEVPQQNVSSVLIEDWRTTADTLLQGQPDDARFLLLQSIAPQVLQLHARGYPERAALYRDALLSLVPFEESYAAEVQAVIQSLHSLDAVSLESASKEALEVAPIVPTPEQAHQAEARARAIVRDAGAALTVDAGFMAVSPTTVAVHSVLFASPKGDRLFSFDLDTEKLTLQNIKAGDEMLPYPMSLEMFLGWVEGE